MNDDEISKFTEDKLNGVDVYKPFYKNKLDLPYYFRFGFEIEALIDEDKLIHAMNEYMDKGVFCNDGFKGVPEATISYEVGDFGGYVSWTGGEIVTPILSDNEKTWRDIKVACDYLESHARLNNNCSVHLNIGAQALGSDYKNWYNFLKILAACEPEIYKFTSQGKPIREIAIAGGYRSQYAYPIAKRLRNGFEFCEEEGISDDINALLNACDCGGEYQHRKDKSVSFKALYQTEDDIVPVEDLDEEKYDQRIEVRMANGSFDPIFIQQYTKLFGRIFDLSRNMTPEVESKLDRLLRVDLPNDYNSKPDISRALDVANILFDNKDDKLQFLYTMLDRPKKELVITSKEQAIQLLREENIIFEFLPDELKQDRDIVLEAVKHGGAQLQFVPEEFRNDKDIVLEAVVNYGRSLQYASSDLQKDKDVVLAAIRNDGMAMEFTTDEFKKNYDFAMTAVKSSPYAIMHIDDTLKDNFDIAMQSVSQKGNTYQYIGENLRDNKDLALAAVSNCPYAIRYLNEDLEVDKDIMYAVYYKMDVMNDLITMNTVTNDDFYLYLRDTRIYRYMLNQVVNGNTKLKEYLLKSFEQYSKEKDEKEWMTTDESLRFDEIAKYTVRKLRETGHEEMFTDFLAIDGSMLKLMSDDDRDNFDYVNTAIKTKPYAFEIASERLRGDKRLVLNMMEIYPRMLEYASPELRADRDVVTKAVQVNGEAIKYASSELRKDKDLSIMAVTSNGSAIYDVDKSMLEDKDFALAAVTKDGKNIQKLQSFKGDRDVAIAAIRNKPFCLEYVSEDLRGDRKVVKEAISRNDYVIRYASKELQAQKDKLFEEIKAEQEPDER